MIIMFTEAVVLRVVATIHHECDVTAQLVPDCCMDNRIIVLVWGWVGGFPCSIPPP